MKNKDTEKIYNDVKRKISISNFVEEEKVEMNKNSILKNIAVASCIAISITGVVFATNYEKIISTFGLGKGIDGAVEDGYIAEPNMEYITSKTSVTDKNKETIVNDIEVKTKIEDFLMDDLNISTHFLFEIDKKINNIIDFDELNSVKLDDLIVTDDENNILFCMNKDAFDKYCKENNLNYSFTEFNEKYYNCGLNSFIISKTKENANIQLTYNMYTDTVQTYPKCKKLHFKFTNITLMKNDWIENENSVINLRGNWLIDVDVPEKMYNRQSISYKVIKTDNDDFEVTSATLYDTGFEFGMIVSNLKQPEVPQLLIEKGIFKLNEDGKAYLMYSDELNRLLSEDEEVKKAFNEYRSRPIETYRNPTDNSFESITYVENEDGKKFESTMSPSRRADGNYIEGNKYSFFETFGLTPSEATDKLKVKVLLKGKQYTIELEKVQ